jgi:site-specific recombinase
VASVDTVTAGGASTPGAPEATAPVDPTRPEAPAGDPRREPPAQGSQPEEPVDLDALAAEICPRAPKHRIIRDGCKLLDECKTDLALPELLEWAVRVGSWLRARGKAPTPDADEWGDTRSARLAVLVRALELASPWRRHFAARVARILAETNGIVLFCEIGLPADRGFASEAATRWARKWLPAPPNERDLSELLARLLPAERDIAWLDRLKPELCARLLAVLDDGAGASELWRPVRNTLGDSIALLATRVSALGLAADVRARSPQVSLSASPFFRLPRACDELLVSLRDDDAPPQSLRFRTVSGNCQKLDEECRGALATVYENLERSGVSVDVVYRLDLVTRSLDRLESLLGLMAPREREVHCQASLQLLAGLLRGRLAERSVMALYRANMQLLARKIIERAGTTGEHYITATRGEYFKMILSAGGGGVLTAGTAALKYIIGWAKLPVLIGGILASANYAGSFVLMQMLGFTLATKQPSMTAAALANALHGRKGEELDDLVTQIARTTRSQLAAAIGNIGLVIPAAWGVDLVFRAYAGRSFLDGETSAYILHSLHPLESGTIPFAAFTGILLWVSSVAAGWLENWVVYERLPDAIEHHPIRRFIGRRATAWLSRVFLRNVSGFGGNVTLGTLLGMVPVLGSVTGLPIDVRHVTLSTAGLVLAVCSIGDGALRDPELHWAAAGIAIIGILNFVVSFMLAVIVALRARDVDRKNQLRLVGAVLKRFFTSPLQFFFPPAGERSSAHGH